MDQGSELGGMNSTPRGERLHIAFFGMRNAGKSSLVNAVTGQQLSVVSDVKGTTTDPVYKSMELLPLGPVTIIDTPGFDDEGTLGELRIQKTRAVLQKADIAVLAIDVTTVARVKNNDTQMGVLSDGDTTLIELFKERGIPFVTVFTKQDTTAADRADVCVEAAHNAGSAHVIQVSAASGFNISELKDMIATLPEVAAVLNARDAKHIIGDLLQPNDLVVLVIPVDKAAPKGRLILPQQQTIRDILDSHATAITVQTDGLAALLDTLKKGAVRVRMVVTDSQAFGEVASIVPSEIPLTSFSILFARYKGCLEQQANGAAALDTLKDGDVVLISEACTHHRQCGDIGTQKLPNWICDHAKCKPQFIFTSGTEFPADLTRFSLVIHCGACMITEREMQFRLSQARAQKVAMTNYGTAIAHIKGILPRALDALDSTVDF